MNFGTIKSVAVTPLILFSFFFSINAVSAEKNKYLYCKRTTNPPIENRGEHDWQYEELEISLPAQLESGVWNIKIGSGYFDLTDLGNVSENAFNVKVYHVNDPYAVVADTEDPYGTLKGSIDNRGQWKVVFKGSTWKKSEKLNCEITNTWMFRSAENSWQ